MTKLLKGLYAVGVAAVLTASATSTQAADLKCRIPFGFTVHNSSLPAGVYEVSISGGIVRVRGLKGGAFALTSPTESAHNTTYKLVFEKLGDAYVLREAWMGASGRVLPGSRRDARRGEVASNLERVEVPLL